MSLVSSRGYENLPFTLPGVLFTYVLYVIYMSNLTLSLYASIALLLHVPFDCPLALLPFLMPEEQIEIVTPV